MPLSLSLPSCESWQQTDRLLRIHTRLGADVLLAERMVGIESLFGVPPDMVPPLTLTNADWDGWEELPLMQGVPRAGYAVLVDCLSTDAQLDLETLPGQPALLEWQTDADRTHLRPLHGLITQAALLGTDGGFARYRLVLEPGLAWLAYRRDSWVFQDASVIQILSQVLNDYRDQIPGMQYRFDLQDASVYRQRSYCVQYQENDLDFIARLCTEEGLSFFFEHTAATEDSRTLGHHTLVFTDQLGDQGHSGISLGELRFHRSDATETRDTIQHWYPTQQVTLQQTALQAYDYATLDRQPVSASSAAPLAEGIVTPPSNIFMQTLGTDDDPGLYAYQNRAEGQRLANAWQQAQDARSQRIFAAGTVRQLTPAASFTLAQHDFLPSGAGSNSVRVLWVAHSLRSNLSNEIDPLPSALSTAHQKNNSSPLYTNLFTALPIRVPYRPQYLSDASSPGALLRRYPKPTAPAAQTAIVVGQENAPIDTDRNHRVKVQFHWQRGQNAHNRLQPPGTENNAPANQTSSTWIRVGTPQAGSNFGGVFIPRLGQEVAIGFYHGDIDRPVILGALYNGSGSDGATGNAQSTGAGISTGNAPLWFHSDQPGHGHANHLSGLVTQSLSDSQSGAAQRYSQWVLDDTPQQARLELSTTQHQTQLQLGHAQEQVHNQRRQSLGHGISLSTQAYGAVRAGAGLLLSTDGKATTAVTLDSAEPLGALMQAEHQVIALANCAQEHQAMLPGETTPQDFPATQQLKHSQTVLRTTASTSSTVSQIEIEASRSTSSAAADSIKPTAGGAGQVTAWSEPALVLSSPDGIGLLTPQSTQLVANGNLTQVAHDLEIGAQGNLQWLVQQGAVLFTYGDAAPNRTITETGIKLHAATGALQMQAHAGAVAMHADKTVTLSSQTQIDTTAKTKVLLAAGGSSISIQGGAIVLKSSGSIALNGSPKSHTSALSASAQALNLPQEKMKGCALKSTPAGELSGPQIVSAATQPLQTSTAAETAVTHDEQLQFVHPDGYPLEGMQYTLHLADGTVHRGTLDQDGKTQRISTAQPVEFVKAEFASAGPVASASCCSVHATAPVTKSAALTLKEVATNPQNIGTSLKTITTPRGESRPLTADEITMAQIIFGDSIDYSQVKIHNEDYLWFGLQGRANMTPNGEMYLTKESFREDFSKEDIVSKWVFMHEMTHIWQYQRGYPVKLRGAIRAGLSYKYTLDPTKTFSDFNMEAQGNIIADYFAIRVANVPEFVDQPQDKKNPDLYEAVLSQFISNPHNPENLPDSKPALSAQNAQ